MTSFHFQSKNFIFVPNGGLPYVYIYMAEIFWQKTYGDIVPPVYNAEKQLFDVLVDFQHFPPKIPYNQLSNLS
jgi:hypothetical protein